MSERPGAAEVATEMPELLTIAETSRILRLSYWATLSLAHQGLLPCVRIGRRSYRIPADALRRQLYGGALAASE